MGNWTQCILPGSPNTLANSTLSVHCNNEQQKRVQWDALLSWLLPRCWACAPFRRCASCSGLAPAAAWAWAWRRAPDTTTFAPSCPRGPWARAAGSSPETRSSRWAAGVRSKASLIHDNPLDWKFFGLANCNPGTWCEDKLSKDVDSSRLPKTNLGLSQLIAN